MLWLWSKTNRYVRKKNLVRRLCFLYITQSFATDTTVIYTQSTLSSLCLQDSLIYSNRLQLGRFLMLFFLLLFLFFWLRNAQNPTQRKWMHTQIKYNGGAALVCARIQRERDSRFVSAFSCSLRLLLSLFWFLLLYAPHLCVLFGQFCTWSKLSR